MKKFTLFVHFALLITIFNLSSCKKEVAEVKPQPTPTEDVSVKDGRLIFKERESFESTIAFLASDSTSSIINVICNCG